MASHTAIIGLCVIELYLHGVSSLKEKRSLIKPLLDRLHKTFNVSASEVGYQDVWQSAAIAVATVTTTKAHAHQEIQTIIQWIERNYPDMEMLDEAIEIL